MGVAGAFSLEHQQSSQTMANATQPAVLDLAGLGRMFYIASPSSTSFPDFIIMTLLEWAVLAAKGKRPRINDGLFSIVHGLIMTLMEYLLKGVLFSAYLYIHANHCLYRLPWDSPVTWVVAALGIDFCYYWVHRAHHEINVLWAAHQVHHSSEDYNLTTALRQSAFQGFGSWPLYLPMAFFVPPAQAVIHKELNLLYQFWIHTELVQSIGPLEWVLNAASHHRVHHGANRYCLDKNYAGVLIIWDRMFGTFEWERDDEPVVYGLVDQPQFFNPLKHQMFYYGKVIEKAQSMNTSTDKLFAFIKGPGWFPGTPRLGDPMGVPEIQVREKYNPKVAGWINVYTVLHFVLVFFAFDDLGRYNINMSPLSVLAICAFLFWTLTSIGMLFDNSPYAWLNEFIRSAVFLILYVKFGTWNEFKIPYPILVATFSVSMIIATISMTARLFVRGGAKEVKIK